MTKKSQSIIIYLTAVALFGACKSTNQSNSSTIASAEADKSKEEVCGIMWPRADVSAFPSIYFGSIEVMVVDGDVIKADRSSKNPMTLCVQKNKDGSVFIKYNGKYLRENGPRGIPRFVDKQSVEDERHLKWYWDYKDYSYIQNWWSINEKTNQCLNIASGPNGFSAGTVYSGNKIYLFNPCPFGSNSAQFKLK